jgi:BarA-like signal transduction histidine kinase
MRHPPIIWLPVKVYDIVSLLLLLTFEYSVTITSTHLTVIVSRIAMALSQMVQLYPPSHRRSTERKTEQLLAFGRGRTFRFSSLTSIGERK